MNKLNRRQFNKSVSAIASLGLLAGSEKLHALTSQRLRKKRDQGQFQPAISAAPIGTLPTGGKI